MSISLGFGLLPLDKQDEESGDMDVAPRVSFLYFSGSLRIKNEVSVTNLGGVTNRSGLLIQHQTLPENKGGFGLILEKEMSG